MTHILVVDDCAVDRKMVGGLLQQGTDWRVSYAKDGNEAMGVVRASAPDLVVTDLQMPGMSGLQLVREVVGHFPSVPVMLITSEGSEEVAMEALAAGAASYSPKRLLSGDLIRTARRLLRNSGETRRRARVRQRMVSCHYHFCLENDTALIPPLVELFQNQLVGWDESERLRMGVAVDEALVNAIYHGNLEVSSELREQDDRQFYQMVHERARTSPYAERRVNIYLQVSTDEVEVRICDQGPGYDPGSIPDPTAPDNLDKVSGRGLLLIRTFMDEVNVKGAGNEIEMRKRRKQSDGSHCSQQNGQPNTTEP